ncbi:MAG: D-aminoacyl-tRNA deacylase [Candidatus Bathyarchaeia archaeon]
MILLVASTKDIASMNIAQKIIDNYRFKKTAEDFQRNPVYVRVLPKHEVKLVFVNKELIHTQFLTEFFAPKLLVFVSRHSSVSGIPTLSVHTPGNFGEAEVGGITRKISVSPASAMKEALLEMARQKEQLGLNYKVSYECTHHGPSLDVPTMFVELGSSPVQWKDLKAAEAVAHAAMAAATRQSTYSTVLGVGGPHYNEKFTRMALTTKVAFGHIIPKYAIPKIDAEMIEQCIRRTVEEVRVAVFDWKGMRGADKARLITILSDMGVSVERA